MWSKAMGQATDLAGLWELMGRLFPHAEEDTASFVPRPTDVIISPYSKCGTTWLQQMVHSLRTGGDTDFEDIYEVVPWIAVATQLDLDLDADQRAEPRAFKSHAAWDAVPSGCRYIVSFRDPKDQVVSMFRMLDGFLIEPGTVPLEQFAHAWLEDTDSPGSYWDHTTSWLTQRDNPDVLLLTFDDMKRDLQTAVRRVAQFLGTPTDERRLATATEHSSFSFMSRHSGPFEEPWLTGWAIEHLDLPHDAATSKVRSGQVGENRRQLSPETTASIDRWWAETVGEATGLMTYDELVEDLRSTPAR